MEDLQTMDKKKDKKKQRQWNVKIEHVEVDGDTYNEIMKRVIDTLKNAGKKEENQPE